MTTQHPGIPGDLFRLRTSGWIVSLSLHVGIIFLAGLLVAKIRLAPPSPLFQWDVTVVHPADPGTREPGPSEATAAPENPKPRPPGPSAKKARSSPSVKPSQAAPVPPLTTTAPGHPPHNSEPTPQYVESRQPLAESTPEPVQEQQRMTSEPDVPHSGGMPSTATPEDLPALQQTPAPLEAQASPPVDPSTRLPESAAAPHPETSNPHVASVPSPAIAPPGVRKPDYGWLADSLLQRIESLKQYPASARLNHLEGRVILRIVIEDDGRIASIAIAKSSGHDVLDQAALDTLRRASPIALSRPLEKSPVTIQIPLSYRLGR